MTAQMQKQVCDWACHKRKAVLTAESKDESNFELQR